MTAERYIAAIHQLYTVGCTGPNGSTGPTDTTRSTGSTGPTGSTGSTGPTGPIGPCPSFLHRRRSERRTLCQIVEPQGVLHIKPLFTFRGNVSPCTGTMSDPGLHFES